VLVPAQLPVQLAISNARLGVPCHGAFAVAPPPPEHAMAWCLALAPLFQLLPPVRYPNLLVVAPTLPGLAWAFPGYAAWLGPPLPSGLTASVLLDKAVTQLAPDTPPTPDFSVVVAMDPVAGPPFEERIADLCRWLKPGGRLLLAFEADPSRPLALPTDTTLAVGVGSLLPGAPDFDLAAFADATRSSAIPADHPIAVVALERS